MKDCIMTQGFLTITAPNTESNTINTFSQNPRSPGIRGKANASGTSVAVAAHHTSNSFSGPNSS